MLHTTAVLPLPIFRWRLRLDGRHMRMLHQVGGQF